MYITPQNAHCIRFQGKFFFSLAGCRRYFISPCGTLLSTVGGKLELLYPSPQSKGYLQTGFVMDDGSYKRLLIHRLVAQRFLPSPDSEEKNQVDHLDNNRQNNAADNLEWVTHKENSQRARARALVRKQGVESFDHSLKRAA